MKSYMRKPTRMKVKVADIWEQIQFGVLTLLLCIPIGMAIVIFVFLDSFFSFILTGKLRTLKFWGRQLRTCLASRRRENYADKLDKHFTTLK